MFSRRKNQRAAAHAANAPPTSSAASTAAVQAFMASRAASSNLSSAAAAAALRSQTTSPTNPATIQTKRMQRRGSASSNGSAASRPTLQRAGSNGSMTERTFRDNSPLRSVSPAGEHPPIPPLPKNLPKRKLARPSSVEPPARVASPSMKAPAGRGVSLDRGNVRPKDEPIPPMPIPRPARLDTVMADETPKRTSINFSRPMSPVSGSPAPTLATPGNGRTTKPDQPVLSQGEVDKINYTIENEATAPVKKKKKRVAQEVVEGSHLAAGHGTGRPTGTAVDSPAAQKQTEPVETSPTTEATTTPEPAQKVTQTVPKAARPVEKLTKKPSMVKEDAEGELEAEKAIETPAKTINSAATIKAKNTPNGKVYTPASVTPSSPAQVLKPSPSPLADPGQRRASLSPSRTARFSSQLAKDMTGSIKHEPSLRANSPAKSALKNSSRGPSPALLNNDVSDNASVASEEGRKKKKTVRVSFDDTPAVVTSTSPEHSPLSASRGSRHDLDSPEPDDKISPMPTLPSFGSIRGRREMPEEDHKVLYGNEQTRKNLADMTSSSDHAVGAILAQDSVTKRGPLDPLPPQVTSVEGSGYNSAEDSDDDTTQRSAKKDTQHTKQESSETSTDLEHSTKSSEEVPAIAILPATPGHDADKQDRDGWLSEMPGKFQESPEKPTQSEAPTTLPREAIVEPEPESAQREHSPETPAVGMIAESLLRKDEEAEDDSGDSVYNDAAEDPVVLEGDGFGSIDAIVDTPVVSPVSSPVSKIKGKDRFEDESPSPANRKTTAPDWEATKTYWSGVNESKKAEADSEAVGIAVSDHSPVAETVPILKEPIIPAKSTKRATKSPSTNPPTSEQSAAPKKPALKKSMRPSNELPAEAANEAVPTFRKTMRGAQPVATRPPRIREDSDMSIQSIPTPSAGRPATRPSRLREDSDMSIDSVPMRPSRFRDDSDMSVPTTSTSKTSGPAKPAAAVPKKGIMKTTQAPVANGTANKPSLVAQTLRQAPPVLNRNLSNDSDSDSSFKKERRRRPAREGGFARKSMRAPPGQSQAPIARPQETSPAPRSRPVSMSGVSLRTSMRDQPPVPKRPSSVRVSSPNGSFFGRKKKADSRPKASRTFSDDSVDDRPSAFRSKYADSSDDEDVANLAPVRGIPRRTEEEDSTDLDDSDQETKPKTSTNATTISSEPSALANRSMRSSAAPATPAVTNLAAGSTDKKKKSFFGILGRKKEKSKIAKSELDSPARRDTPLERTKLELNDIKNRVATPEPPTPLESPVVSPPQSPSIRPGKLRRRSTYESQRIPSSQWPLPPSPPPDLPTIPASMRPTTSDGSGARPKIGSRQISTATYSADGSVLGRSGKKKRFPMLRRAFGLHD